MAEKNKVNNEKIYTPAFNYTVCKLLRAKIFKNS